MKKCLRAKVVVAAVALLCMAIGIEVWMNANSGKEAEPYYTEHEISLEDAMFLNARAGMVFTPAIGELTKLYSDEEARKASTWPDFTSCTYETTDYTQAVADVMNDWMFGEASTTERSEAQITYQSRDSVGKAEEYGITADNPITVSWISGHPTETIAIMEAFGRNGDIFENREYILGQQEKSKGDE